MSTELRALLGDKFTPTTHDYCMSNRRSSHSKKLEGWASVGEMTNHGEVIIVLARPKPPAPTPVTKAEPKPTPNPTFAQRFTGGRSSTPRGTTK